ncbi:MAG: hypothetical protein EAZ97_01540 [Bacteroidetes bacterium]|nr:MAG: hypothetical protein EAZ97_01540 [Bacteroidota bacterium]
MFLKYFSVFLFFMIFSCQVQTDFGEKVSPLPKNNEKEMQAKIDFLGELIRQYPKESNYYYHRADVYLKAKKEILAESDILQAIQLDSSDHKYFYILAQVYILKKDNKQALKNAEKALQLGCEELNLQDILGDLYLANGQNEKAIRYAQELERRFPHRQLELYYNQGVAYANLKDSANAVMMLEKVLAKQPNNENAYKTLAELFVKIGSRRTALAYIQRGLDSCQKSLVLHFKCAQIYESMGKREFANYWCLKSLDIDPTYAPANYLIASFYREKENFRGEYEHLLKAIQVSPSVFGHWRVAKYLDRTRKEYAQALSHCNSALLLEPQNTEIAEFKAFIIEKIKKEEYKKTPEYQEELKRWKSLQKNDSMKKIENPPTKEIPNEEKKQEGEGN